jgi:hypothetical protein
MRKFPIVAMIARSLVAMTLFLQTPLFAQEQQESARLLTVWAGMLPIILCAPHGGREPLPGIAVRRGIGVPQFTTERDNNTLPNLPKRWPRRSTIDWAPSRF